jgi:O-glycosyl hydrolase
MAADVSINLGTTFQTIDGMGTMDKLTPWKVQIGPFYVDAPMEGFYDSLINVMGLTIMRPFITCGFESSPGVYAVTDNMRTQWTRIAALKAVADASSEPFRVTPAVLSPPGYMKYNNQCPGDQESTYHTYDQNSLKPDCYDDYAEFVYHYVQTVRDSFGVHFYAFSPQNEPYFNEPYESCSYSGGQHYSEMLQVVGPRLRQADPDVLVYGCEHMAWAYPSWENAVLANGAAAPYIDRFAVHGYTDGIKVDTTTFDTISATGRPLWMSETSGYCPDYDAAMTLARTLMKCLVNSNMSAWIYVGLIGQNSGQYGCGWIVSQDDGTLSPRYWIYAQFFRFVRPGMQRLAATSSDNNVMVGAFSDDTKGSVSVVLINNGASATTASLSFSGGAAPPDLEMKRTSPSENFIDAGTVLPTDQIPLPANSVVSLGYRHRGSPVRISRGTPGAVLRQQQVNRKVWRAFDLAGRRVGAPVVLRGKAAGVFYLSKTVNGGRDERKAVCRLR